MTNTIFFNTVFRDDASSSSISSDQISQQLDTEETQKSSSSIYSIFSKAISGWTISRRPEGSSKFVLPSYGESGQLDRSDLQSFRFEELEVATNSFHLDNKLGEGCFGKVFKGWIHEKITTSANPGQGIAVAVKRLDHKGNGGSLDWDVHDSFIHDTYPQGGHIEWLREVEYLGRLYHPNLVRLCGHCVEGKERLLVYEFMSHGSLDNQLFQNEGGSSGLLSWSLRMKIALGAAKGLAFLHSPEINVIHRGFKSSDILLDSGYNAKISDFGLAMDGSTGDIPSGVFGTPGYVAPEHIAKGCLSTKSDVYSFGVVLLEILSGRRITDYFLEGNLYNLWYWANPSVSHEEKVFHCLDRLEGQYSVEGAQIAVKLALMCMAIEAQLRPDMDDVVIILEGLQDQESHRRGDQTDRGL